MFCINSEFPSASAWPQPAWHHHQVRWHGEERDQQTSQAEREEEWVKEKAQVKSCILTNLRVKHGPLPHAYSQISEDQREAFADAELIVKSNI